MGNFSVYELVIGIALIIIASYGFNKLSSKTSIPSVLMLILTGFVISQFIDINAMKARPILALLGNVGLIMIVLEASLDLKLEKSKSKLLISAFFAAFILLILIALGIGVLFKFFFDVPFLQALIYAIPLAIMSSAIIIPSVSSLSEHEKEFLIFESALSDIMGIMVFYFLADALKMGKDESLAGHIFTNLGVTLFIAILLGYAITVLLQRFSGQVKLFLPIAVLLLLYGVGKLFHLSSLIFVLAFGLMINNKHIFFQGKLKKLLIEDTFEEQLGQLKLITLEASFIVRTFFFILFGMSISISQLYEPMVWLIGATVVIVIFGTRYLYFAIFDKGNIFPASAVAPRGLITVLLFYSIVETFGQDWVIAEFNEGILLLAIIITNIVMMAGLIKAKPSKEGLYEDKKKKTNIPKSEEMRDEILEEVIEEKLQQINEESEDEPEIMEIDAEIMNEPATKIIKIESEEPKLLPKDSVDKSEEADKKWTENDY
jgi:NhaP-type Na+/H+ or K+/H+ antiporter